MQPAFALYMGAITAVSLTYRKQNVPLTMFKADLSVVASTAALRA